MTPSLRSKSIQRYSELRPDMAPTLGFFEKLWNLQDEIAENAAEWDSPTLEEIESSLANGRILFAVSSPDIPADAFRDALRAVSDLLAEEGGLPLEQSDALRSADYDAIVTDEMVADLFKGMDAVIASIHEKLGGDDSAAPLPTISFVVTTAVTPFVTAAATKALKPLDRFDWTRWSSGICPVCGTPASFGKVVDAGDLQGGKRMLSCPLCRAEWEFDRLRCSRCGERNFEKLEYLFDESDRGHRIHTCKTCHGYIKVSFEKDLGVTVEPAVEEVIMLALDGVAAQRGFTPLGDDDTGAAN